MGHSAGPADLDGIDLLVRSQAKVLAEHAGGAESLAPLDLPIHQEVARLHRDLRTDCLAIALHARELQFQPVIPRRLQVAIEGVVRLIAGIVSAELREKIERSISIDIGKRDAVSLIARPCEPDEVREIGY